MKKVSKRWLLGATTLIVVAAGAVIGGVALASGGAADKPSKDLGQSTGLLPRDHLTLESAINVNLDKETVRLPLYRGEANGETVWFTLMDSSDAGAAHDLGVNYAPKLANLAIGCPECVQTVTQDSPTPDENKFGQAVVHFQGAPDFSPDRVAEPGPDGFPLNELPAGRRRRPGLQPVHPDRWFADRVQRADRRHGRRPVRRGAPHEHLRPGARDPHRRQVGPGQFEESWVDMLFVKGFDAGEPIVYISTDAGQPLSAVLERSTYVPALDKAAYNGGDDFLGSARERLFGFINGQTGADNPESQGFQHLVKDGHAAEDASAGNTALINALRNGGDLLNVFGDFPTLSDPRHAQAYSPLWDAQLGLWTNKAVQQGVNTRQIDEAVSSTWRRPDPTC